MQRFFKNAAQFSIVTFFGRHPVECCFPITTMLKTSFSVQTWSVRPAAIAGVRGSHFSPDFSSAGKRRVFNGLMKL